MYRIHHSKEWYILESMPPEGGACMLNGMRRSYSCGVSKANTTSVQRRAHRIVYARTVLTPAHIYGLVFFSPHSTVI